MNVHQSDEQRTEQTDQQCRTRFSVHWRERRDRHVNSIESDPTGQPIATSSADREKVADQFAGKMARERSEENQTDFAEKKEERTLIDHARVVGQTTDGTDRSGHRKIEESDQEGIVNDQRVESETELFSAVLTQMSVMTASTDTDEISRVCPISRETQSIAGRRRTVIERTIVVETFHT